MQLRPWQWEFLLGIDGRTRLGDLAHQCGLDLEIATELVHQTEALGLVEIVTVTLASYRAAAAPAAVESSPRIALAASREADSLSPDSISSIRPQFDTPASATAVAIGNDVLIDVDSTRRGAPGEDAAHEHAALEHVPDDVGPPEVALPAPKKKDDVLLQHYYVGATSENESERIGEPRAVEPAAGSRYNGDLAVVVLRALGLKK